MDKNVCIYIYIYIKLSIYMTEYIYITVYIYIKWNHFAVQQKLTQYCKSTILQLNV